MDDIQTKENIYNNLFKEVKNQQKNLDSLKKELQQLEGMYLENIIDTAILSESLRRRKDSLCVKVLCVILIIIPLIMLSIDQKYAIGTIVAEMLLVYFSSDSKERKVKNYNDRKKFFDKYNYIIPENKKLDWRTK